MESILPDILTLAQQTAPATSRLAIDLLAILATAGLVAVVARRLNLPVIPLYLVAGAVIGPHALGLAGTGEGGALPLTSLATVLLMFTVGLHLDISALRGGLLSIALVTAVTTAGVSVALWPIGVALGMHPASALAVGMALSLTSTAVILRMLEQRREMHTTGGRLAVGVTIMHDLAALVILAAVPLLAAWAKAGADGGNLDLRFGERLLSAGRMVGAIVLFILAMRLVLPYVMRSAARSAEAMLVVSAAMALLAAVVTASLGFSPELGAFLAGFLLAGTPFRYQISGQLAPLRDLFMAVFFMAIGLGLPLRDLIPLWWVLPLAAGAMIVVKVLVTALSAWAMGASPRVAVFAGFALGQGSEFSFVVLGVALAAGAISPAESGAATGVVVLSLVAAPWLFSLGAAAMGRVRGLPVAPWIARSALREAGAAAVASDERPQLPDGSVAQAEAEVAGAAVGRLAIVAGFGPVGRAVADNLEKRGVVVTVIELNPRTVERQNRLGRAVVYGDASNLEVLERAGLSRASAVVLTMPDEEAVIRASSVIRAARPDVFVAARLNVLSRGLQAMSMGADHVVVEELATAEAMAAQVLLKLEQRAAGEDTGPRLYELGTP